MLDDTHNMDVLVFKKMITTVVLFIMLLHPGALSSRELECEAPNFLDHCFLAMPHRGVNGTVTYHCDEGYWFTGTKTRVCQQNLTWSGNAGVCIEVLCPSLPKPTHGRIEMAGRQYKDKALVICDEGYIFSQRQYNPGICQENNTWTFKDGVCKKIRCQDLPDLQHGKIVYRGDGHKAVATMMCNEGYSYSRPESVTRRCQANSTWSSQNGVCEEVRCPDIAELPLLGTIVYHGYSYKARATVDCNVGYIYSKPESMTRTCQGDNTWSLQFDGECEQISNFCPSVPYVDNAITFSKGAYYGSIVTYKCDDGYKLTGSRTIRCEANRQWSTLSAKCEKNNQAKSILWIVIPCIVVFIIIMTVVVLWLCRKNLRGKCRCPDKFVKKQSHGQIEGDLQLPLNSSTRSSPELAHLQNSVKQFVDENMNTRTTLVASPQQVVVTDHCVIVPRT